MVIGNKRMIFDTWLTGHVDKFSSMQWMNSFSIIIYIPVRYYQVKHITKHLQLPLNYI